MIGAVGQRREAEQRLYCATGHSHERSLLQQRLRRRKRVLEVVLQANALPASPWPELADPRVRVSFTVSTLSTN